jgi:hypothetical protein
MRKVDNTVCPSPYITLCIPEESLSELNVEKQKEQLERNRQRRQSQLDEEAKQQAILEKIAALEEEGLGPEEIEEYMADLNANDTQDGSDEDGKPPLQVRSTTSLAHAPPEISLHDSINLLDNEVNGHIDRSSYAAKWEIVSSLLVKLHKHGIAASLLDPRNLHAHPPVHQFIAAHLSYARIANLNLLRDPASLPSKRMIISNKPVIRVSLWI